MKLEFYFENSYHKFFNLKRLERTDLSPSSQEALDINAGFISINLVPQLDGHSCVPCCIKMVLDQIAAEYPSFKTLDILTIGKIIGTTEGGTVNGANIDNINDYYKDSNPSVKFVRDHRAPYWDDIRNEISNGRPVICYIEKEDDRGKPFGHAVLVTGYMNRTVYFNDSMDGKIEMPIGEFLERWQAYFRFNLKVRTEERKETKLTEFMEVNE